MFIIIVIVAIIVLVINIIRIKKVNNEYFSEARMDEMARIAAEKATRNVTKITCDYCGMVIDITAERVCPHCGATYGNDEEYLNRNTIDEGLRDKEYKLAYERAKEQVKRKNRHSYKVIRTFIIVSAIVAAVFLVPMIIFLVRDSVFSNVSKIINGSYISDYSSDNDGTVYIDGKDVSDLKDQISDIINTANNNADAGTGTQDYVFKNTEIIEDEKLSAHFGTISIDKYGSYLISVQIQNKSNEDICFMFDLSSVNHVNNWGYFYEEVAAGKTVTKDFEILNFSWDSETMPLKEIVIYDVEYYNSSFDAYVYNPGPFRFETTSDYVIPEPVVKGQVLFEDKEAGITLSYEGTTNWDCTLYFTNTSDNDYSLDSVLATVNGNETYGTVGAEMLLAHSQFSCNPGYSFDADEKAPYNYTETFILTDMKTGETISIENINLILEEDSY